MRPVLSHTLGHRKVCHQTAPALSAAHSFDITSEDHFINTVDSTANLFSSSTAAKSVLKISFFGTKVFSKFFVIKSFCAKYLQKSRRLIFCPLIKCLVNFRLILLKSCRSFFSQVQTHTHSLFSVNQKVYNLKSISKANFRKVVFH